MNAGTCWGKNTIDPWGRSVEKAPGSDFNFNFNYQLTLGNIPQERRTRLHRVRSLKSRKVNYVFWMKIKGFGTHRSEIKIDLHQLSWKRNQHVIWKAPVFRWPCDLWHRVDNNSPIMSEWTSISSHQLFCLSMASFYVMILYSYCRILKTFLALPLERLIEASRGLWNSGHIGNLRWFCEY
jgi:hypothetical protein